jgi:C1A family cysteine protease
MKRDYSWKSDSLDARDIPWETNLRAAQLPRSINQLHRHNMPPSYDQDYGGTCTANAATAALTYEQLKLGHKPFAFSRLFVYYNERVLEHTENSDAGAMNRSAVKVLNKIGACSEIAWPYDLTKMLHRPYSSTYNAALHHRCVGYRRVAVNEHAVKTAVFSDYPVIIGLSIYEYFESDTVARSGVVPMPNLREEKLLGGHAVLLMGYDDDTQQFLVRNSWGTKWGVHGYFHIPYDYVCNPELADDFWILQP